jgi:hypothetical protein
MPQFVRNQQAENQYRAQSAAAAKQPAADGSASLGDRSYHALS